MSFCKAYFRSGWVILGNREPRAMRLPLVQVPICRHPLSLFSIWFKIQVGWLFWACQAFERKYGLLLETKPLSVFFFQFGFPWLSSKHTHYSSSYCCVCIYILWCAHISVVDSVPKWIVYGLQPPRWPPPKASNGCV